MEYDLALMVNCALHPHSFSCMYLIKPGVGAAGEETVELSDCVSQRCCLGRGRSSLLQGGGDRGPHSWEPSSSLS